MSDDMIGRAVDTAGHTLGEFFAVFLRFKLTESKIGPNVSKIAGRGKMSPGP